MNIASKYLTSPSHLLAVDCWAITGAIVVIARGSWFVLQKQFWRRGFGQSVISPGSESQQDAPGH